MILVNRSREESDAFKKSLNAAINVITNTEPNQAGLLNITLGKIEFLDILILAEVALQESMPVSDNPKNPAVQ
jgi:hypothetical protein